MTKKISTKLIVDTDSIDLEINNSEIKNAIKTKRSKENIPGCNNNPHYNKLKRLKWLSSIYSEKIQNRPSGCTQTCIEFTSQKKTLRRKFCHYQLSEGALQMSKAPFVKFQEDKKVKIFKTDLDTFTFSKPMFQQVFEDVKTEPSMQEEHCLEISEMVKDNLLRHDIKSFALNILPLAFYPMYFVEYLFKLGSMLLQFSAPDHLANFQSLLYYLCRGKFRPELLLDSLSKLLHKEDGFNEAYSTVLLQIGHQHYVDHPYVKLYYAQLEYHKWKREMKVKNKNDNKRASVWDDEIKQEEDQEKDDSVVTYHGSIAINNLAAISTRMGTWDVLLPCYVELITHLNGRKNAKKMLREHLQNNSANPVAYWYLLNFMKRGSDEYIEVLQDFSLVDVTHDLIKDLFVYYKEKGLLHELWLLLIERLSHKGCVSSEDDWQAMTWLLRQERFRTGIFQRKDAGFLQDMKPTESTICGLRKEVMSSLQISESSELTVNEDTKTMVRCFAATPSFDDISSPEFTDLSSESESESTVVERITFVVGVKLADKKFDENLLRSAHELVKFVKTESQHNNVKSKVKTQQKKIMTRLHKKKTVKKLSSDCETQSHEKSCKPKKEQRNSKLENKTQQKQATTKLLPAKKVKKVNSTQVKSTICEKFKEQEFKNKEVNSFDSVSGLSNSDDSGDSICGEQFVKNTLARTQATFHQNPNENTLIQKEKNMLPEKIAKSSKSDLYLDSDSVSGFSESGDSSDSLDDEELVKTLCQREIENTFNKISKVPDSDTSSMSSFSDFNTKSTKVKKKRGRLFKTKTPETFQKVKNKWGRPFKTKAPETFQKVKNKWGRPFKNKAPELCQKIRNKRGRSFKNKAPETSDSDDLSNSMDLRHKAHNLKNKTQQKQLATAKLLPAKKVKTINSTQVKSTNCRKFEKQTLNRKEVNYSDSVSEPSDSDASGDSLDGEQLVKNTLDKTQATFREKPNETFFNKILKFSDSDSSSKSSFSDFNTKSTPCHKAHNLKNKNQRAKLLPAKKAKNNNSTEMKSTSRKKRGRPFKKMIISRNKMSESKDSIFSSTPDSKPTPRKLVKTADAKIACHPFTIDITRCKMN